MKLSGRNQGICILRKQCESFKLRLSDFKVIGIITFILQLKKTYIFATKYITLSIRMLFGSHFQLDDTFAVSIR